MTTKKIPETKFEFQWSSDFVDEFLEWFYEDGNANPFILDNFNAFKEIPEVDEPPTIEFKFYRPDGKISRVTIINTKHFFIDDEENYDEIYESIDSEYKELNFFVEDDKTLEPCPWYESVFKKNTGVGYQEIFTNLDSLKEIPTEELPKAVRKNCEKRAEKLDDLVENYFSDCSKVSPWDRLYSDSIKFAVPYHPYMFELLPELGKAHMRFKKDSSYYEKVNKIINKETRQAFKKANDNLNNNEE